MGFSAKQLQALKRQPSRCHIRTREAHGRELTYLEGWYAISEANRIFGFDGWSRETIESKCVLARETKGTFLAVYIARVRLTVQADGATVIREGHGTGEGRGTSPGEVHDIALKAAETDATKRALATFGRPFGLELYRGGKAHSSAAEAPARAGISPCSCRWPCRLPPRRHDADPETVPLLRPPATRTRLRNTSGMNDGRPNGRWGCCRYMPQWQPRHRHRLRRWRLMLSLIPCPAASTRACSPSPSPSGCATRRISGSLPHSPAWSAAGNLPTRIICALPNPAPSVSKSATSSPCPCAAVITGSCIRPAMKSPGGESSTSSRSESPRRFGRRRIQKHWFVPRLALQQRRRGRRH